MLINVLTNSASNGSWFFFFNQPVAPKDYSWLQHNNKVILKQAAVLLKCGVCPEGGSRAIAKKSLKNRGLSFENHKHRCAQITMFILFNSDLMVQKKAKGEQWWPNGLGFMLIGFWIPAGYIYRAIFANCIHSCSVCCSLNMIILT